MLKANTRPIDDQRAALAILGFMRADSAQIHYVLEEAAAEPAGPAGLILALTEAAAIYAKQVATDAEDQISEKILELSNKPE